MMSTRRNDWKAKKVPKNPTTDPARVHTIALYTSFLRRYDSSVFPIRTTKAKSKAQIRSHNATPRRTMMLKLMDSIAVRTPSVIPIPKNPDADTELAARL